MGRSKSENEKGLWHVPEGVLCRLQSRTVNASPLRNDRKPIHGSGGGHSGQLHPRLEPQSTQPPSHAHCRWLTRPRCSCRKPKRKARADRLLGLLRAAQVSSQRVFLGDSHKPETCVLHNVCQRYRWIQTHAGAHTHGRTVDVRNSEFEKRRSR